MGGWKNLILFLIPSSIWGSTWLAIKYQLGVVDPLISVFYRFILASLILLIYCKVRKINLKYRLTDHVYIALQGILLFGVNYWLVYLAEIHLTSGLVALLFSTIIFMNIFNGRVFLKSKVTPKVIAGATLGTLGIFLVFRQEILLFSFSEDNTLAFSLAVLSVFVASLGNISSARNQKKKLPVLQSNAFGMLYGSVSVLIISLLMDKSFQFDFSFGYTTSLFYLAIFGSIFAFWGYLTLLGKIGADRAAYVSLIFPIIALILSTIFENYRWTVSAFLGVAFILSGNFLVLRKS